MPQQPSVIVLARGSRARPDLRFRDIVKAAAKRGEPGWDRTIDHLIKSQVLYH
jgi:hypothetical protein